MKNRLEQTKEERQKLIETMLEEIGSKRSKVVSLRMDESMLQALEFQAQEWNLNISETVRKILNFYFLPIALELEWKKFHEEQKEEMEFEQLLDVFEFLYDDFKRGSVSLRYLLNEAEYISTITGKRFNAQKRELEEVSMRELEFEEVQK